MNRSLFGSGWLRYIAARAQKKMALNAIKQSDIHPTAAIEAGSQIVQTTMGRHSFCGYGCTILNCEIGAFCSIADSVYIGGSHHPMHYVSTSPVFLSHRDSVKAKFSKHPYSQMPRTIIGNDVWIGVGSKIKAGVVIGDGAVVGMGSVVTRDVKPYAIVAGNPAREIRKRFSEEKCTALLESKWWLLDDETLTKAAETFTDPAAFIESLCR